MNTTRGRPSGAKTRNTNTWTESRFSQFIKGGLRGMSTKWGPGHLAKKLANVSRGFYLCAECKEHVPTTLLQVSPRKRVKNIFVDHIKPVVDPAVGFVDWNTIIERMFCEIDNLQVLCKECHDIKSKEETEIAKIRRAKEKNEQL